MNEEIFDFRIHQYRLKGTKILLCWWCGRRLYPKSMVKVWDEDNGHFVRMHKSCAEHRDLVKVQGIEDLEDWKGTGRWRKSPSVE